MDLVDVDLLATPATSSAAEARSEAWQPGASDAAARRDPRGPALEMATKKQGPLRPREKDSPPFGKALAALGACLPRARSTAAVNPLRGSSTPFRPFGLPTVLQGGFLRVRLDQRPRSERVYVPVESAGEPSPAGERTRPGS